MKERKRPERTCIVCKNKFDKRDLKRIVRNKEGQIFYDPTGKANGRGAYLCNNPECIENFLNKKFLNRAFRTNVSQEDLDNLQNIVKNFSADSEEKT